MKFNDDGYPGDELIDSANFALDIARTLPRLIEAVKEFTPYADARDVPIELQNRLVDAMDKVEFVMEYAPKLRDRS